MMNELQSDRSLLLKHKGVRALGVILTLLLLTVLTLQLVLHLGWNTYTNLDQITAIAVDGEGGIWVKGFQGPAGVLLLYQANGKPVQIPLHLPHAKYLKENSRHFWREILKSPLAWT